MQKMRASYILIGFLAGIIYVSACGGGAQSIADAVTHAMDIVFDNSRSDLTATTAQEAVNEVDASVDTLESSDLSSLLVGTWTGNERDEDAESNYDRSISITFNADGTYSCTNFGSLSVFFSANVCDAPSSWSVDSRTLKITHVIPDVFNASGNIYLPIYFVSSSKLNLINGSGDAGVRVMLLEKS